jgi:hypothetical protein
MRIAFFIAIAVVAYFFWRDIGRREIDDLADAGAVASSTRRSACCRSTSGGGCSRTAIRPGRADRFVVAAICGYAGVRTWLDQRTLV